MTSVSSGLTVRPLRGIPAIRPGDDLAHLILASMKRLEPSLAARDVLVVAQKVVSKAEGAVVDLNTVTPGDEAMRVADAVGKDPRAIEVILADSVRVVRSAPGVLITETHHGLICANAGVDTSNSLGPDIVIRLPGNPDESASKLRETIAVQTGVAPSVIISDTFNRPWRQGSMNVAIGTAGFTPLHDARGTEDDAGNALRVTMVSLADEIASAAQLVMGESGGVPAAVVSGLQLEESSEGSASLLRDPATDLFK